MNILITNDDGIQSEGIQVLSEKLSEKHNVFVLAPNSNRSAVSHHLTMSGSTKLFEYKKKQWACSGFPSDCAFIGTVGNFFNTKMDVVVSGINSGGNMGTDIIYSGTCAGARQAVLDGVPSIAVSVEPVEWDEVRKNGFKYNAIADFVAKNLENLIKLASTTTPRVFVNVNGASITEYKGVKFTEKLCVRRYGDNLQIKDEADGKHAYYVMGFNSKRDYDANSDAVAVQNGYVSVSRVLAEAVCVDKQTSLQTLSVDDFEFKL